MTDAATVRRGWLIAFGLFCIIQCIEVLGLIFERQYDELYFNLDAALLYFIAYSIRFSFIYYFAYEKAGTRLLTFLLIVMPATMLMRMTHIEFIELELEAMLLALALYCLTLATEFYFWVNCFWLRTLNAEEEAEREAKQNTKIVVLHEAQNAKGQA